MSSPRSTAFAHYPTSSTSKAPVYVASSIVCRRGRAMKWEVGVGVSGRVREATMLRESHYKGNESCKGEQAWKGAELEKPWTYAPNLRTNGNYMRM